MREKIRGALIVVAFVACCLDWAWLGAYALIVRWAAANPEEDPIYRFFKRLIYREDS